jgi:hypothetical protein
MFCKFSAETLQHILLRLISFLFLFPVGCTSIMKTPILTESFLRQRLAIGEALPLEALESKPGDLICALYPYQEAFPEGLANVHFFNNRLQSIGYEANEYSWAFVFGDKTAVTVSKFSRSRQLDILSAREVLVSDKAKIPKGFMPADCVPINKAGLAKIKLHDRTYLILGEVE